MNNIQFEDCRIAVFSASEALGNLAWFCEQFGFELACMKGGLIFLEQKKLRTW